MDLDRIQSVPTSSRTRSRGRLATTDSTEATPSARAGRGLAVLERVAVTLVLAGAAALLLSRLDEPFDESGATQRLFGALRPWSDLLGQPDFRHPALFFVFLRASLRLEESLGYEAIEAFARLPAALAAWVAAFLTWRAVRRALGPLRSLAVLTVLVACPPFLLHARDVGNLTLFMALVVGTSAWMASLIARASRPALAGFAVLEALMFFANHLAVLVWAVHAATVAVHARGRTRRWLLGALAASAVLAFRPLSDLAAALPVDMGLRQAARAHPDLVWGEVGVTDYLGQALAEFITLDGWGVAVALVVGLGALRLARRAFRSAFAFLHLALVLGIPAGLAVASFLLRLQPSYLGFLAPSFAVLVVCGATGFPSGGPPSIRPWWRSAVGPMLAVTVVAILGRDAGARAFGATSPDGYRVLGRFLKSRPGGRVVATDHHGPATLIIYYGFEDPAPMVLGCRHGIGQDLGADEVPLRCVGTGGTYLALSDYTRPGPETERLAIRRFRRLAAGELWYVEDVRLPGPPGLASEVRSRCSIAMERPPVRLFRCEDDARAPTEPGRAGASPGER